MSIIDRLTALKSAHTATVETLHDDGPLRITAHTSNAPARGWNTARLSWAAEASAHDVEQ